MRFNFKILIDKRFKKREFEWIEKQFALSEKEQFIDYSKAKVKFHQVSLTARSPHRDILAFIDEHLSDIGIRRLNGAIKSAKRRKLEKAEKCMRLQISLNSETALDLAILDESFRVAGLTKTKTELITLLIGMGTQIHDNFLMQDPEGKEKILNTLIKMKTELADQEANDK